MKLRELLASVEGIGHFSEHPASEHPAMDVSVTGLTTNSHATVAGNLFIGMPGTRVDGGEFWQSAIASGAVAAIISPDAAAKHPPTADVCVLVAADMTSVCAQVATAFYGFPARKLKLVGVTGTNGKTTTTHLIEYLLEKADKATALMGTLYTRWKGFSQTATHTTPFAVDLQRQLAAALDAGSEFGLMEVSSHALAQGSFGL
jgi:UDP-N-acetylmuramoyl-L-alanyl-D-glutamate--2,6-diaminopimelate ligase